MKPTQANIVEATQLASIIHDIFNPDNTERPVPFDPSRIPEVTRELRGMFELAAQLRIPELRLLRKTKRRDFKNQRCDSWATRHGIVIMYERVRLPGDVSISTPRTRNWPGKGYGP